MKLIFTFFLLGFSLGLGPCLFSCGPLLVSYISANRKGVRQGIGAYLIFSLGRAMVYVGLAAAVSFGYQMGEEFLGSGFYRVAHLGAGAFIAFTGLLLCAGKGMPQRLACRMRELFLARDKKTVFLFGIAMGLLPCYPLISALSYIGLASNGVAAGVLFGLAFAAGTALSPLLLLSAFAGLIPKALGQRERAYAVFNFICGAVVFLLGAQLMRKAF
jgi:thiol:disulfide interchange protein DsbD